MNKPLAGFSLFILTLVALSLFTTPGCLGKIDEWDRFNSSIVHYAPNATDDCKQLDVDKPCTCMVCSEDKTLWGDMKQSFKDFINWIKGKNVMEATLAGARCQFVACNVTMYKNILADYQISGEKGTCEFMDGRGNVGKYNCAPRMFMIGAGASSGEFSISQRYCQGRLNMPVVWATPKIDDTKKEQPPQPPPAGVMMCYLQKGQLPIVVYYSGGKYMQSSHFEKIASFYNGKRNGGEVDGPVIITTEAMLDVSLPSGRLDKQKLDQTRAQIEAIMDNCPKCMIALSIKPLFSESNPGDISMSSQKPDLCALDYMLNDTDSTSSNGCAQRFGMSEQEYNEARYPWADKYAKFIEMIGVGFMVNEDSRIPACSSEAEIGKYLLYSRMALMQYYKPSVWYAVGMSPGATNTPGCNLTETDVANAYNMMMGGISGLTASGIIGMAPYRFLDNDEYAPMKCDIKQKVFNTNAPLSEVGKSPLYSDDGSSALEVKKVLSSNATHVYFASPDQYGSEQVYFVTPEQGANAVYLSGCQFGFKADNGEMRKLEAYSWFSNCQYYFTNKAPAADGAINAPGTESPLLMYAYQQPIMFSMNGRGPVCALFEANKMAQRVYSLTGSFVDVPEITPPTDPKEQKTLALLQCGGCMFDSKMPYEFCDISAEEKIDSDACTDYPQIDDAFLMKGADPIAMRALATIESSLGGADPDSSMPPACAISRRLDGANCGGGDKSPSKLLASQYLPYCPKEKIQNWIDDRDIDGTKVYACALGMMQCIEAPGVKNGYTADCGSNYNPFNPYQSACCGVNKFQDYYTRAKQYLTQLKNSNLDIANEVTASKFDWYAAVLAAYAYNRGPGGDSKYPDAGAFGANKIAALMKYNNASMGITFAQHMRNTYDAYGFSFVKRYNKMIKECGNGCPYQSCEEPPSGGDGGDGGDGGFLDPKGG